MAVPSWGSVAPLLMERKVVYEAQVKYGLGEPWRVLAVRGSHAEAAEIASHGFTVADPAGRLPWQVRVLTRGILRTAGPR